ncbi:MAG TPA: peptidoglycan-binding domain-containing protein [Mycobacteriales bacterium]|jgi:hypothetical protein|nr:peptidoglycan-binding domain-containing protein [Mycobacteriales bacterium]
MRSRLLAALLCLPLSLVPSVAWADAHIGQQSAHKSGPDNTTPYWANNSLTGYCGQTDGGYVVAVQLFLQTYNTYTAPIDGKWGPQSHDALARYQANTGRLQHDGCAGPDTWYDMQRRTKYLATSTECYRNPGDLNVYAFRGGSGRVSYYDRSTWSGYWYADTYFHSVASPAAEHLYRFSDDLHAYC